MKLKRKTIIKYKGKVHDLTVKNTHTYNIENIAVHNSGGGCLASYLTGITAIDPIQHNLLFERFYNAGRNTATRISLPDIDSDFPVSRREDVIRYIVNKYGADRVGHMATFSTLDGRGALREVMRYNNAPFDEINSVTSLIIEKSKVTDQMEESGHSSILSWMMEFRPKMLAEFVVMNDEGLISGDYAQTFIQAMKIERRIKAISQHASGIVVTKQPLLDVCPAIDRDGTLLAAMNMQDLEALGMVKLDVLGLAVLDKLGYVNELLSKGIK